MKKFTLFLMMLVAMATTVMAQTPINYADFNPEKTYRIYNKAVDKGDVTWKAMTFNANSKGCLKDYNAADETLNWKLVANGNGYRLYNVSADKYLGGVQGNSGVSMVAEANAQTYSITVDSDGQRVAFSHTDDDARHCLWNDGGNNLFGWKDDTSQNHLWYMEEVKESVVYQIIYKYTYNNEVVKSVTHSAVEGSEFPSADLGLRAVIVDESSKPTGTVTADGEYSFALTYGETPFEYSVNVESISNWYYIRMNPEKTYYLKYNENCYNGNADIEMTGSPNSDIDSHTWAFVGNPLSGFKLINKAAGTSKAAKLATGSVVEIVDYASSTNFFPDYGRNANNENLSAFTDGLFSLHNGDASGNRYMNQRDATTTKHVASWNAGLDRGSTMWVIECHELSVTDAGWASLCLDFNATIPAGVEVYAVTDVKDGNWLAMTQVTGVLPANTGVLVKANQGDYMFNETEDAPATIEGNLLVGTITQETANATDVIYVLAKVDDNVGLYKANTESGDFTIKANGAYLPASALTAEQQNSVGFRFDFATTAVEKVEMRNEKEEIYDLQGRRINEITEPGIYIVNGVKVLVK